MDKLLPVKTGSVILLRLPMTRSGGKSLPQDGCDHRLRPLESKVSAQKVDNCDLCCTYCSDPLLWFTLPAMTSAQEPKFNCLTEAIASAFAYGMATVRTASETAESVSQTAPAIGETIVRQAHQFVEQGTERIGRFVTPFVENPWFKFATKVPVINVLIAAVGQVNVEQVQKNVEELRRQYPLETPQQLAHRVMVDAATKAAGIGLVTNIIPPVALMLFAVDIAAISALQAEMVYRIAEIYGFDLREPTRRGEVIAIWGLSAGGASVLKTGLSIVEIIPGAGTVVGVIGDASLLYSLGYAACRFYESKQKASTTAQPNGSQGS